MKLDKEEISRRRVLTGGAAIGVGLTAGAGIAAARGGRGPQGGGGKGYVVQTGDAKTDRMLHDTFTITMVVDESDHPSWFPTPIPASCNGNSGTVDHIPYETTEHWIFFPENREVTVGIEYETASYTIGCTHSDEPKPRDYNKVVVKPA